MKKYYIKSLLSGKKRAEVKYQPPLKRLSLYSETNKEKSWAKVQILADSQY